MTEQATATKARCPQCGEAMVGTHKLIIWGDLKVLACPNMPLGEIATVQPVREESA